MTVKEVLIEYLKKHGYDGLYCDECACLFDDLAPCCPENWITKCEPGYKQPCPPECSEHPFHVGAKKGADVDEIKKNKILAESSRMGKERT